MRVHDGIGRQDLLKPQFLGDYLVLVNPNRGLRNANKVSSERAICESSRSAAQSGCAIVAPPQIAWFGCTSRYRRFEADAPDLCNQFGSVTNRIGTSVIGVDPLLIKAVGTTDVLRRSLVRPYGVDL